MCLASFLKPKTGVMIWNGAKWPNEKPPCDSLWSWRKSFRVVASLLEASDNHSAAAWALSSSSSLRALVSSVSSLLTLSLSAANLFLLSWREAHRASDSAWSSFHRDALAIESLVLSSFLISQIAAKKLCFLFLRFQTTLDLVWASISFCCVSSLAKT